MQSNFHTFYADAVLFDMDGTLTDSIAAVEAAWGKVAKDIGQDPAYVIAATHGKRAVDNLAQFKPAIRAHEMDAEVQKFEETILFFADAYRLHGPGALVGSSLLRLSTNTSSSTPSSLSPAVGPVSPVSPVSSGEATPDLVVSPPGSLASSRASSFAALGSRRPSFATRLSGMLAMSSLPQTSIYDASRPYGLIAEEGVYECRQDGVGDEEADDDDDDVVFGFDPDRKKSAPGLPCAFEDWQIEAARVDRAVRILPGVRKMIDSIPEGRYAVATSGAKTYAHGCMTRVGITPPKVTITADDKRLRAGKPAPDPFLLAARQLGFSAANCVVFEDSPSGIRAGLASGATVIAVCTSHARAQIEHIGAHFVVENMESVVCEPCTDGRLRFTVRA